MIGWTWECALHLVLISSSGKGKLLQTYSQSFEIEISCISLYMLHWLNDTSHLRFEISVFGHAKATLSQINMIYFNQSRLRSWDNESGTSLFMNKQPIFCVHVWGGVQQDAPRSTSFAAVAAIRHQILYYLRNDGPTTWNTDRCRRCIQDLRSS